MQPATESGDVVLPTLRVDLEIYDGVASKSGMPTWVLHDPVRNKFFSIGWLDFEVLKRWGSTTIDNIIADIKKRTTLNPKVSDIHNVMEFVQKNHLIHCQSEAAVNNLKSAPSAKKSVSDWLLHGYLFFRVPLFHPDNFLEKTYPFVRFIFSRQFAVVMLIMALSSVFLISRQWPEFMTAVQQYFSLQGAFTFALALIFSKCIHELGHAYACKRYGLKVPVIGVAFLVMWPFLFTDTNQAWKLSSANKRIVIGLSGVLSELYLAIIASMLWVFMADGPIRGALFFIATTSWILTIFINLNPFMKWDGYYIFSDMVGFPNLLNRAFAFFKWKLREMVFSLGYHKPEIVSEGTEKKLILYAISVCIYRVFLFLGIALIIYAVAFKTLAIILIVAEISFFLIKPIYKEWLVFKQLSAYSKSQRPYWLLAMVLLFSAFILFVPFNHGETFPGVLRVQEYSEIYTPTASKLQSIEVKNAQQVVKGELIATLTAPNLEYELAKAKVDTLTNLKALQKTGTHELIESKDFMQEKLHESLNQYRAAIAKHEQLKIFAQTSGTIFIASETLKPGIWLAENTRLGKIVQTNSMLIEGVVEESLLSKVKINSHGTFYADDKSPLNIPVKLTHIDLTTSDATQVSEIMKGYDIPYFGVSPLDGTPLLTKNVYRVILEGLTHDETKLPQRIVKGTVHIKVTQQSLARRMSRAILRVFHREFSN